MIGLGVETVGTDAGAAHSFDPPFPCHSYVLGAGKYGLTQLQNLARLPADRRGRDRRAAADRRRAPAARRGCWRWSRGDGAGDTSAAVRRPRRVGTALAASRPRRSAWSAAATST